VVLLTMRRSAAALAVTILALIGAALVAAPAHGASTPTQGWIRLAHFSPDTPQVDVYLSAFGKPGEPTILRGVGYGAVSPYQRVDVGSYTVAMRGAGAPATDPPVISTTVQVGAGTASTVAGMGRKAALKLVTLNDDLAAPQNGQSKVRVINAAMTNPKVDGVDVAGQKLAAGLAFAETTGYTAVPAGQTTVAIGTVKRPETLAEGGTYTLVVKDVPGGVDFFSVHDSAAAKKVPIGGVNAGQGGDLTAPWALVGAAAVLGVAVVWLLDPARRRAVRPRG
jgi:Domain of unknown function (DUF4397)